MFKQKMKTIHMLILFAIGIFAFNSCSTNEECIEQTWYQDSDGDGFGNPNSTLAACIQPEGYVNDNTDFDDLNEMAYLGAEEICDDNIDNDGDGEIDECSLLNIISGAWQDNFNDSWTIDNTASTITTVSNNGTTSIFIILATGSNYVICLNAASNPFFADL